MARRVEPWAAVGAFRVVPERDLGSDRDPDHDTRDHLRDEGLIRTIPPGEHDRAVVPTLERRSATAHGRSASRRYVRSGLTARHARFVVTVIAPNRLVSWRRQVETLLPAA